MADYAIDDATIQNILDSLLSFLSSVLPPPIYSIAESLITHSLSVFVALLNFVYTLASAQNWDAQKVLPPLITLLAAYLALVSFYRTTGWMIRMAFAFVKWGFILTTLGGAAGYFFANANPGGNGLAMFGDGLLPTLGGMFLDMFNEGKQQGSTKTKGKARGSTRGKTSTKKSRSRTLKSPPARFTSSSAGPCSSWPSTARS